MTGRSVTIKKYGPIARLVLRGSAINETLVRELPEACEAIGEDSDARVVVLNVAGRWSSLRWDPETIVYGSRDGVPLDPFNCLAELSRPVICVVRGEVLDAGLELALACDVRFAADDTRFGLPNIANGVIPMAGGTQRLPRLVGRGKALEMILTGESIDAQEALRIGLVNLVYPQKQVMEEAKAMALRIAERGPVAVRYAKEAVSRGVEMPLEQALRFETDLTVILQTTDDRAEGVKAFLEKRKPEFKGK